MPTSGPSGLQWGGYVLSTLRLQTGDHYQAWRVTTAAVQYNIRLLGSRSLWKYYSFSLPAALRSRPLALRPRYNQLRRT